MREISWLDRTAMGRFDWHAVALMMWALASGGASAAGDAGVRQIDIGDGHACAVTHGGALLCWGENKFGQIGNGLDEGRARTPSLVIDKGVQRVSTGHAHTCAVVSDALYCWGWNLFGQTGTGAAGANVLVATRVIERGVVAVSAGAMHTCAVVAADLQCWGQNDVGQLGTGAMGNPVLAPTRVIAGGVSAVASGAQHICALVQGALLCWGSNRDGQVGVGEPGQTVLKPVTVIASGATAVAAQSSFTCAVADAALWCWGKIDASGVGPNARSMAVGPQRLIASGVTGVAAGPGHVCAIVHGGLQCWGYNGSNSFGTGQSPELVLAPRQVIAAGVTAVAAGTFNTCVLISGALRCRGHSPQGQVPGMAAFEWKPFGDAGGDVAELGLALASAQRAAARSLASIAGALKGRIVVPANGSPDGLAYQVSGGRASMDLQGDLVLELDVFAVLPLRTEARGGGAGDVVTANNSGCGAATPLTANRLNTTALFVLEGDRFLGLEDALRKDFSAVPGIPRSDAIPSISGPNASRLRTCAQAVQASALERPFKAIRYTMNNRLLTVPPTVDGRWTQDADLTTGSIMNLVIDPIPGRTDRFSVQVASTIGLQCGVLVLRHPQGMRSTPWRVPQNGMVFEIDRDFVDSDSPQIALPTLPDLQQMIAAKQGTGLPLAAAPSCQAVKTGEEITVRYAGQVVQHFGVIYPSANPIDPPRCEGPLPMPALHAANDLGYTVMGGRLIASCKRMPNDPGKTIIVVAAPVESNQQSVNGDVANLDLNILLTETGTGNILRSLRLDKALLSDADRLTSLTIDTARYLLAGQTRAFGVRSIHQGSSQAYPSERQTLDLFVDRGGKLEHIVRGLRLSETQRESDINCPAAESAAVRAVAVAASATNGLFDLIVTSPRTDPKAEQRGPDCLDAGGASVRSPVRLRFDGTQYIVPIELQAR